MKLCSIFFSLVFLMKISAAQHEKMETVAGTRVSLVPPFGFVQATNFSGFQNVKESASIMVNEMDEPVQEVIGNFTAENLQSAGITLLKKEIVDHLGAEAGFLNVSQPLNGNVYLKQILIFGDESTTIMVTGIYPESRREIADEIRKSLMTANYNRNKESNPLSAVKFTIDPGNSGFKFSRYMSGSLLFTTDGKVPTESADKAIFIAGNSIGEISMTDQKQFCIDRLKKLPRGELNTLKDIRLVTIDLLNGFEIIAHGKDPDDADQLVYQVLLFEGSNEYYIFVGTTSAKFDSYLATFRTMTQTFKRK